MFDVGFSELLVIGIVALVVIGPERLPKVAHTTGLLFGRLQRYVNDVKADISREIQLDELKALRAEMQDSAHHFERTLSEEMRALEQTVVQENSSPLVSDEADMQQNPRSVSEKHGTGMNSTKVDHSSVDFQI